MRLSRHACRCAVIALLSLLLAPRHSLSQRYG